MAKQAPYGAGRLPPPESRSDCCVIQLGRGKAKLARRLASRYVRGLGHPLPVFARG